MLKLTYIVLILLLTAPAQAQFLKSLGQSVTQKIANKAVDKKLNPKKKSDSAAAAKSAAPADTTTSTGSAIAEPKEDLSLYGTYDFIPGDSALFVDDLQDEQLGEIPSKWIVGKGKCEVSQQNGEKVMLYYDGAIIFPRMKESDYLPARFTIEFDLKWPDYTWKFGKSFRIKLFNADDQDGNPKLDTNSNPGTFTDPLRIWNTRTVEFGKAKADWPKDIRSSGEEETMKQWAHVAIAVNEKGVKTYVNQFRILNAQVNEGKPSSIGLTALQSHKGFVIIKNFRIMAGGKNPYKQVTTEKVYIARGIQFELNSAQLKPESMGDINNMVKLMKDNPDWKFEIGGHASKEATSNSAANQQLSEARAQAVKAQMIHAGVTESRLTAKGYGDTKPMTTNDTPEGRATNRRVEFVRQ